MARGSAQILDDDEELDLISFMLDACGIDDGDFFEDERVLTRENLEKNLKFLMKMVESRSSRRAAYFVIGYLILITGSRMPDDLRYKILNNTKWEDEENRWLDENKKIERKIYLNDFHEKIRSHIPGKKLHPIKLIYLNGKNDLYIKNRINTIIGINEFKSACKTGMIYNVRHVIVQGWGLESIPKEIFRIKDLETLGLEFNCLKEIPDDISNLFSLKILFLSYNNFKDFPKAITKLPILTTLSLNNNYISTLPEYINQLKSLKTLYIRKNKITRIPTYLNEKLRIIYQNN